MVKVVSFDATGGPEVMRIIDADLPPPGRGELRVRHTAIGLNFIDTYHRSGLYPIPLPGRLGLEAAGVVEAVGPGVNGFAVGDRIAYGNGPRGAYAETANVPANRVLKLVPGVSDETAAGMMLKGMTVSFLTRQTYTVKSGDTVVFLPAAGGVGLIFGQWVKALGARAIGVVGSDDKIETAKAHGYEHVLNSRKDDIAKRVKEITGGAGVPVVYDGVGKATFMASLDCLRPRGLMVSFGNASGPVTGVDLGILAAKGSLYVTRPSLLTYAANDSDLERLGRDVLDMVSSGKVKIGINQRYPLADVISAHRDLENRRTTGTTILIP
ncbi:MAG: quinone oxidoreductase family protein [Hyphomicrobiales bacterium]